MLNHEDTKSTKEYEERRWELFFSSPFFVLFVSSWLNASP
jgi:hypothetical protein